MALGKAVMDRGCGEHAAVAAAAADDHVGALLQQLDERMHAGHRDDSLRRVELGLGQRLMRLESRDRFAGAHAPPQVLLADFGIEIADLEARQADASRRGP